MNCCFKKHGHKVFTMAIILLAIVLATVVSIWHEKSITYIIFISRCFDIMLPILAVGALIKYLVTKRSSCGCHTETSCEANTENKYSSGECCRSDRSK